MILSTCVCVCVRVHVYSIWTYLDKIKINSLSGGWSLTGSTRHGGHWLAYSPCPRVIMMMENLVEWRLAGETEALGKKPAPAPLCPPQIAIDQTRDRTRASAVGTQRLPAWVMARPTYLDIWRRRTGWQMSSSYGNDYSYSVPPHTAEPSFLPFSGVTRFVSRLNIYTKQTSTLAAFHSAVVES
jgi:hypothetical protein